MQLVVLLALVLAGPNLPGVTCEFPTTTCVGEQPANQSRSEWEGAVPRPPESPPLMPDTFALDSIALSGELGPGMRVVGEIESWGPDGLDALVPLASLPAACQATLDETPEWLRPQLASAFRRLGDSSAIFYAGLIRTTPQRCRDEVAFTVATMGPEVLRHPIFNYELLYENARWIYLLDDSLPYVELVERTGSDGNYTTARYRVLDGADTVWVELPRDIYYYYVVHPTTSDEIPRFDDYVYNKHWREYFFCQADSGFPRLGDYIKQAQVVWFRHRQVEPVGRPFDPADNALDVIGNWVTRTNVSGASGNRPIHPNVIAHEHNGNCGEIQDLWTAACRTCLMPTVNCSDPCEDHVWNEFWDGYWLPLASDPSTHIADSGVAYEEAHGGSKRISGVFNWRGDGYWWSVTGHFSNACSLYVRVLDALGRPMDGCRVLVYSEGWYGGLSVCTAGGTDGQGAVPFELGDLRNFYLQVQTPLGTWPDANNSVKVVSISQTGAVYFSTLYMSWAMNAPRPTPQPWRPSPDRSIWAYASARVAVELDYGFAVIRGAGTGDPDDSIRFYHYYSDPHPGGTVDYFVLDSADYGDYAAGGRFGALLSGDDAASPAFDFVHPDTWSPSPYYVVFSSEDKFHESRWVNLSLKLFGIIGVGEKRDIGLLPRKAGATVIREPLAVNAEGGSRIYDSQGRLVQSVATGQSSVAPDLSPGTYFVMNQSADGPVRRVVLVR